jgi:hypothetical protein
MPSRWCWNWQTGMVEGHVPQGVWVQLPPSALNRRKAVFFCFCGQNSGGGMIKHIPICTSLILCAFALFFV